jgi:deoxyribonuclease V
LEQGAYTPLLDKEEVLDVVLRTKTGVQPVFISPGYKLDVRSSLSIISQCIGRYRLPEPTRHAHNAVNRFRLGELGEGYTQI